MFNTFMQKLNSDQEFTKLKDVNPEFVLNLSFLIDLKYFTIDD